METHQLFANEKKCRFAQSRLAYLGHIISNQGVSADEGKVEVMLNWPAPRSLKELRGFLGLTGYYQRFVANYGTLAWLLAQLLRKDKFHWGPEAESAFKSLKVAMTQLPVFALPNFFKPFIVETDVSGTRIGVVLLQDKRSIAFSNQALPPSARLKYVYERELTVVVRAV